MTEPAGELKRRIGVWLEKSGVLLEMQTAHILRGVGWHVAQSEPFEDPVSKKVRETDVNARLQSVTGPPFVCFELLLECKASEKRPWLLLTSQDNIFRSAWGVHVTASHLGQTFLNAYLARDIEQHGALSNQIFKGIPLFDVPDRTAYRFMAGGFSAESDPGDERSDAGFRAVMQLLSALEQYNLEVSKRSVEVMTEICEFLIPVIVVNDHLFECWIDDSGVARVEQVHSGVLVLSHELDSRFSNYIFVVDKMGLPELARRATESFRHFEAVSKDIIPAALRELRSHIQQMLKDQIAGHSLRDVDVQGPSSSRSRAQRSTGRAKSSGRSRSVGS
jgi:hypothetical protein